jgi:predicted ATP-dependent endonuclease of OLD family
MQLVKVVFHAFKSLVNMELNVNPNCMGFVGINESGKSNVLTAIHVLGGERKLTMADTPKMAKTDPFITYTFRLNNDEFALVQTKCVDLFKQYIPEFADKIVTKDTIDYNVIFRRHENKEYRYFSFPELNISEKLMILRLDKVINGYQIKTKEGYKNIEDCLIISKESFELQSELEQKLKKISDINELLVQKKDELKVIQDKMNFENKDSEISTNDDIDDIVMTSTGESIPDDVLYLNEEISRLENDISIIYNEIKDYKVPNIINGIEEKTKALDLIIKNELTNKSSLNTELESLKTIQSLTTAQSEKKTELEAQIKKAENIITINKNKIEENVNILTLLRETISEKFTSEKESFIIFILDKMKSFLSSLLPKVVFWEYNEKYLQESVVNLTELLQKKDLVEIPRPLVNIFRIGFEVNSIDDIKEKIKEAQADRNERSRISDQLTDSVNIFLKNIWADYKQEIRITIEENELRVAIFDPEKKHASYYSLIERSQGCRTFISFLLTIGAEANKKVLKNTILLLDEPETHLHPSGVKFMLNELIKISEIEGNIVFYATHSMFMIDRNYFSRNIIVEKKNEISELSYAYSDRIGNFMQEEVLYSALDIEFDEFNLARDVNFVFEGYGDTILFKSIYSSIPKKDMPFPITSCVFHHGGGCDRIMKYFKHKKARMNTKWIFILDSDIPADGLKNFIKKEYKNYIDNDVFIIQYKCDAIEKAELEDLLPDEIKLESYNNVFFLKEKDEIDKDEYLSLIKIHSSFTEQYDEICRRRDIIESEIKGLFKEKLNKTLENDIKNNKVNKEKYSIYYKWFETILTLLKKKDHVQTKSS